MRVVASTVGIVSLDSRSRRQPAHRGWHSLPSTQPSCTYYVGSGEGAAVLGRCHLGFSGHQALKLIDGHPGAEWSVHRCHTSTDFGSLTSHLVQTGSIACSLPPRQNCSCSVKRCVSAPDSFPAVKHPDVFPHKSTSQQHYAKPTMPVLLRSLVKSSAFERADRGQRGAPQDEEKFTPILSPLAN